MLAASSDSLEVLTRLPETDSNKPPLLFVHGAYAGAWCWGTHFLPWFAQAGYPVHAVSLRGHGNSPGKDYLHFLGLGDYVDDVATVAAGLNRPPVLIGHSMGGLVIQHLLERPDPPVAGAVLMATIPPEGLMESALRLAFADPVLFTQLNQLQTLGSWAARPEVLRRALFSPDLPDADVQSFFPYLQQESQRAVLDMTWLVLPHPERARRVPMLVLGAGRDALFPPDMTRRTADAFGAPGEIIPDIAHAMMLEANWETAAARIRKWLGTLEEGNSEGERQESTTPPL